MPVTSFHSSSVIHSSRSSLRMPALLTSTLTYSSGWASCHLFKADSTGNFVADVERQQFSVSSLGFYMFWGGKGLRLVAAIVDEDIVSHLGQFEGRRHGLCREIRPLSVQCSSLGLIIGLKLFILQIFLNVFNVLVQRIVVTEYREERTYFIVNNLGGRASLF